MTDFKNALSEGFAAAKAAEIARREIREVLKKLETDLTEESNGRLLVQVMEAQETLPYSSKLEAFRAAAELRPPPTRTFRALFAQNPKNPTAPTKELARWKQAPEGYPCTITWNDQEHECRDRNALEASLAELLKDPATGEALSLLMRM